jgi:hypothetical protein
MYSTDHEKSDAYVSDITSESTDISTESTVTESTVDFTDKESDVSGISEERSSAAARQEHKLARRRSVQHDLERLQSAEQPNRSRADQNLGNGLR